MKKLKSILNGGLTALAAAFLACSCGSFESASVPHAATHAEPAPPPGQGGDYSTIKNLWTDKNGTRHWWCKMNDGKPYHTTIVAKDGSTYTCSVGYGGWVTWFPGTKMVRHIPQEKIPADVLAQAKHDIYQENLRREPAPMTPEESAQSRAMMAAFSSWQRPNPAEMTEADIRAAAAKAKKKSAAVAPDLKSPVADGRTLWQVRLDPTKPATSWTWTSRTGREIAKKAFNPPAEVSQRLTASIEQYGLPTNPVTVSFDVPTKL